MQFQIINLQGKRNILQNQCLLFDSLPSTNSWIIENIQKFNQNGLLVVCKHQIQGRGRQNNVWLTPKNQCLTFSAVYDLTNNTFLPQILSLVAGISIYKYLSENNIYNIFLKWPNDILIGNQKICGILCEKIKSEGVNKIIIGIGLNVNLKLNDIPIELQKKITSMAIQLKQPFIILDVLSQITQKLDATLYNLETKGQSAIIREWETSNNMLGKNISFWYQKKQHYGKTIKLDKQDGSLIIKKSDGSIQNLYAGEIQMVEQKE